MRQPRVGDDVHYVSYGTPGGEYPSGMFFSRVDYSPQNTPGTWHWPHD